MVAVLEVRHFFAIALPVLVIALTGCAPTPVPTEPILVDAYFSGQALLDVNNNGQVDDEDTPLQGATFIVRMDGGGEFGVLTNEEGWAYIIVPGGAFYPVTARMVPPAESGLIAIEPSTVTLADPTTQISPFLFSSN
jgi:hypothetical protein